MKVDGKHYRSIWFDEETGTVKIIDQRWLPHKFPIVELNDRQAFVAAIRDMWVRGAPLIGATAAYGVAVEMQKDPSDASLDETWDVLHETRPTAINLRWALNHMRELLKPLPEPERAFAAFKRAGEICDEDVECNRQIGLNGRKLPKPKSPASQLTS